MYKAPAFQFYAQDFLTGCTYLTNDEIGMYIKMLCKQWTDGNIQIKRLEFLIGKTWESLSEELKSKFLCDGNFLTNERLEIERNKQIEKSEKAKLSADKRWKKPSLDTKNKGKKPYMRTHDKGISESDAFLEEGSMKYEDEIEEEKETEFKKSSEIDFEEFVLVFNQVCSGLPQVQKLSKQRKQNIKSMVAEHGTQKIGDAFKLVSQSDFLNGNNTNGWKASFDWILKPANFNKIIEGNYGNRTSNTAKSTSNLKQSANDAVDAMFGVTG